MTLAINRSPLPASPAEAADPPPTIAWGRDLPALPAAMLDLLAMLAGDDVDTDELAAKLSVDMALTAKTLRLANSSYYGLRREVTSVPDAIAVLGLRMVKGTVTAAAVTGGFKPPACDGFDFKAFWRHGVATAVAAQILAFDSDVDSPAAFTAGLLYNIGELVFASSFPDRYAPVLALRARSGMSAIDAERSLLGTDHATVGARVAELWRLPESIVRAIGQSSPPPAGPPALDLDGIVDAADRLMRAFALGADNLAATCASLVAMWPGAAPNASRLAEVAAAADLQTQAICASLID